MKTYTIEDINMDLVEMLCTKTATASVAHRDTRKAIIAAALLALVKEPIVPDDEQADQLWHHPKTLHGDEHYAKAMARQWQQIMFLKKSPAIPEQVKALKFNKASFFQGAVDTEVANKAIEAAYQAGLKGAR